MRTFIQLTEWKPLVKNWLKRPQVVAANKMDIPSAEENIRRLKEELEIKGIKVFPVSAATAKGFDELLAELVKMLDELPPLESFEDELDWSDEAFEEERSLLKLR